MSTLEGPRWRSRLKRALPWVGSVAIVTFLLMRTPLHQVVAAVRASAWWTAPVAWTMLAVVLLADTFGSWVVFRRFFTPVTFRQTLRARAASYVLASLNYGVGQAAIVYILQRSSGAPLRKGLGALVVMLVGNILALVTLTVAGFAADPGRMGLLARPLMVVGVLALLYALLLRARPAWMRRRQGGAVLLEAGWRGHALALVARLPQLTALIVYAYLILLAFGVRVPLSAALACFPAVFFVAVLPISVQGVGTTQAAMVLFFAAYAPGSPAEREAAVVAAAFASQLLSLMFQWAVGLVGLRGSTTAATAPGAAPVAPAAAEDQ